MRSWRILVILFTAFVLVQTVEENSRYDEIKPTVDQSNETNLHLTDDIKSVSDEDSVFYEYDDSSTEPPLLQSDKRKYHPIEDDYDDEFLNQSDDRSNYQVIADRLNCSKLSLYHKGTRTEEIQTNSIYKPITSILLQDTEKTLQREEENKAGYPENETTEKTIKLDNKEEKSSRFKRYTITIERLWTDDNIEIIDGYSKVAIYPQIEHSRPKKQNRAPECTAPFNDNGSEYNWYQILVENGGTPGGVNATRLTPNVSEVLDPCKRPINKTSSSSEDLLYDYAMMEFEKVYRREKAFLRFAGTPSEFVDIVGQLVWSPPNAGRRYYRLSYRKDDTGLYINIRRRHKCVFERNPLTVKCKYLKLVIPCDRLHS